MKFPLTISAVAALLSAGALISRADEPFAPDSKWIQSSEGGAITSAGRAGSTIVLRGTGSGISGTGGKAVLLQEQQGVPAITAKLLSLDGAAGKGEAGLRLEVHGPQFAGMEDIGMRLFYRADGTLHYQSRVFTVQAPPQGPPVTGLSLPLWLRIVWRGGGLIGMYSTTGTNWIEATPSMPVTLPPWALPGLLVSSGGEAAPASAVFDHVWISNGDADDNGIKDGWEMKYFGRLLGTDAAADPDNDGTPNIEEWLWGLHPNKADMQPPPLVETLATGDIRMRLAFSNIFFEAAATPAGPWQVLPRDVPVPPLYHYTVTVPRSEPRRFFRASTTGPDLDSQPPFEVP